MAKIIPLLATFGLICLMVLPAPGILGLMIGVACTITIMICAATWLLDRAATQVALFMERASQRLFQRRPAVHAGSGMMRRAKPIKSRPIKSKAAGTKPLEAEAL